FLRHSLRQQRPFFAAVRRRSCQPPSRKIPLPTSRISRQTESHTTTDQRNAFAPAESGGRTQREVFTDQPTRGRGDVRGPTGRPYSRQCRRTPSAVTKDKKESDASIARTIYRLDAGRFILKPIRRLHEMLHAFDVPLPCVGERTERQHSDKPQRPPAGAP